MMQYQAVLDELIQAAKTVFGGQLTGVYLHGSLAMGCFNPKKSDIDLIIVTDGTVSHSQKLRLMEQVVAWNQKAPAKGLELSVVKRENCAVFQYPTPYELHFSPMHLSGYQKDPVGYVKRMCGRDKDLAAHFTMIRKCGIVLCGRPIQEVFAPVPVQDYQDSICCDIADAPKEITAQPIYMVLNLCRVLAFLCDGLCLSKEEGGGWALEHLPLEYRSVIADALRCYRSDDSMTQTAESLVAFADNMLCRIEEKRASR